MSSSSFSFLHVVLVQNTPLLESLVSPFSQPNSEDAIIEMLKYSQKDMDDAIERVEAREQEKEKQWAAKYDALSLDNQELRYAVEPAHSRASAQSLQSLALFRSRCLLTVFLYSLRVIVSGHEAMMGMCLSFFCFTVGGVLC